jgi:hypothetical protein
MMGVINRATSDWYTDVVVLYTEHSPNYHNVSVVARLVREYMYFRAIELLAMFYEGRKSTPVRLRVLATMMIPDSQICFCFDPMRRATYCRQTKILNINMSSYSRFESLHQVPSLLVPPPS